MKATIPDKLKYTRTKDKETKARTFNLRSFPSRAALNTTLMNSIADARLFHNHRERTAEMITAPDPNEIPQEGTAPHHLRRGSHAICQNCCQITDCQLLPYTFLYSVKIIYLKTSNTA